MMTITELSLFPCFFSPRDIRLFLSWSVVEADRGAVGWRFGRPRRARLLADVDGALDHIRRGGQDRVTDRLGVQAGFGINLHVHLCGLPQKASILNKPVEGVSKRGDALGR